MKRASAARSSSCSSVNGGSSGMCAAIVPTLCRNARRGAVRGGRGAIVGGVSDKGSDIQPFRHAPDREAARIAARQGGAISEKQLRGGGLRAGAIKWRGQEGRPHPHHRGGYSLGHAELTPRGRLWAAVLAGGGPEHAALSHRAAAALWDLMPWPSGAIDVSTRGQRRSTKRIRFHRNLSLDDIHYDPEDGLPYT